MATRTKTVTTTRLDAYRALQRAAEPTTGIWPIGAALLGLGAVAALLGWIVLWAVDWTR